MHTIDLYTITNKISTSFARKWLELEIIMLSKGGTLIKHCMFYPMGDLEKKGNKNERKSIRDVGL